MGKFKFRTWSSFFLVLMLAVAIGVLSGCSGDDGNNGAAGLSAYEIAVNNGFVGTEAEWLAQLEAAQDEALPESCAVCHSDIEATHAEVEVAINNIEAIEAASLDISFDVTVDGAPSDAYVLRRAYVNYDDPTLQTDPPTLITTFVRTTLCGNSTECAADPDVALTNNGDGTYMITVSDGSVIDDSTYLFQLENTADGSRPVAIVQWGAAHLRDLVSNDACAACHGDYPAWTEKFSHYAVGGSECQICHSRATERSTIFNSKNAAGEFVTSGEIFGTNITEYIHGIHNSHNMPDGVYYRTTAADADATIEDRYSIGYPSDMRYCAVCHAEPAQLDAAVTAPVSYYLCMTCHNNWDGFVHTHDAADESYAAGDKIFAADDFHRGATTETNCNGCHGLIPTLDEVADFHNDFQGTDAHYNSFYRGEDISFANPNEVRFAIEGVTVVDGAVTFTWNADGDDPCNLDIDAGPTFQALGAYLAYAKGDDWVNEFVGTSPGQPAGSKNLFTSLTTTCAEGVATTTGLTLDPDATYADKVLLAIGGKPLDKYADNAFFVRVPSPTYAFDPADGSAAAPRRDAVDTEKCLGCHRGKLYQHGGDRVDNEQLCVICHNPASNDKNNRMDRYMITNADGTVNTDATYDGLTAQTYDMRYMLHAIHGVSKRVDPWVIYRSRGIYAFVPQLYEEVEEDVFAVDYPKPDGWPADGMTINGSLNDSEIAHNWTVVHYPRPANFCGACHNVEAYEAPDQTKAVAVTLDAGTDWQDQSDDLVIGPAAAACTGCHYTAPVRSHAEIFGYKAKVTRDEMLDKSE